jgi:hypothetical protein
VARCCCDGFMAPTSQRHRKFSSRTNAIIAVVYVAVLLVGCARPLSLAPPPSCAHAYMPACQADLVWGHRYTMWFQTASRAGGSESRSAICNQLDAMELAAFLSSRKVKPIGACAPRCLFLSNASTPGKGWR